MGAVGMGSLITVVEKNLMSSSGTNFYYLKDGDKQIIKSYAELVVDAKKIAAYLTKRFEFQSRILLIFPPGFNFISSFLGCLYAGMIEHFQRTLYKIRAMPIDYTPLLTHVNPRYF